MSLSKRYMEIVGTGHKLRGCFEGKDGNYRHWQMLAKTCDHRVPGFQPVRIKGRELWVPPDMADVIWAIPEEKRPSIARIKKWVSVWVETKARRDIEMAMKLWSEHEGHFKANMSDENLKTLASFQILKKFTKPVKKKKVGLMDLAARLKRAEENRLKHPLGFLRNMDDRPEELSAINSYEKSHKIIRKYATHRPSK